MARICYRRGIPGVVPNAWVLQPDGQGTRAPAVIAVHGLNREADVMAGLLAPRADATGRTIVLPIFDRSSWRRYQRAACAQRSDWAMLNLLRDLRHDGLISQAPPDLSGFSGGAQFAHRFAWLYPQQVARLCLVAPGWWTFPDARAAYPFGIGDGANVRGFRFRANLARFLHRDIQVAVGALDTEQDRNLRQDADVMTLQGAHRVARARRWSAAAIRAARRVGLRPRVSFRLLTDCVHSFADCVANAQLDRLFVAPVPLHAKAQPACTHAQLGKVA